MSPEKRYSILRMCLVLSVSLLAFTIPIYAATVVTIQTTGHIKIANGTNAGISVTPSLLEFGSVTWGTTTSQPITVMNTGDCVESVTATAAQAAQSPVILSIPMILPSHSVQITATYDTSVFSSTGDYTFTLDWTATCL